MKAAEGQAKIQRKQIPNGRSKKASYPSKNSQLVSYLVPFEFKKKIINKTKKNSSSSIPPHLKRMFKELFNHNAQRGLISFLIRESNGILKKPPPPFPSPALLDRNSFVSTVGKRNVMAGRLSQVQLRLIPSEWSENGGAPVRWNNQRRQQGRRGWKGRVSIIKCRVTHPGN